MGFFSEIKSALNEIFATFSQPVVWRGRVMNAIIAEGQAAVDLESGGFVPDETFTVKFLERELDGEYPNLGEIVEYNEKQYRIHWVGELCARNGVSQAQYYKWRDRLLKEGQKAFEYGGVTANEEHLRQENLRLRKMIGDLTIELKKTEDDIASFL